MKKNLAVLIILLFIPLNVFSETQSVKEKNRLILDKILNVMDGIKARNPVKPVKNPSHMMVEECVPSSGTDDAPSSESFQVFDDSTNEKISVTDLNLLFSGPQAEEILKVESDLYDCYPVRELKRFSEEEYSDFFSEDFWFTKVVNVFLNFQTPNTIVEVMIQSPESGFLKAVNLQSEMRKTAEIGFFIKYETPLFIEHPERTPKEMELLKKQGLLKYVEKLNALKTYEETIDFIAQLKKEVSDKKKRFQILTKNGYFVFDNPNVARAMYKKSRLTDLLHKKDACILRNGEVIEISSRRNGKYLNHYRNLDSDKYEKLLLNDRLSEEDVFQADSGMLSVRKLKNTMGFDEIRYLFQDVNSTEDDFTLYLNLYYDSRKEIFTKIRRNADEGTTAYVYSHIELDQARNSIKYVNKYRENIKKAVQGMVDENLMFDEPLKEIGQQDGMLRIQWLKAFFGYEDYYYFNEVKYPVFQNNIPYIPQVCVDFIVDVWERASGTWYTETYDKQRMRKVGWFNLNSYRGVQNRRSVRDMVRFSNLRKDVFQVINLKEKIPYDDFHGFLDSMVYNLKNYRVGDMVVIFGKKDDNKYHYHSFLVNDIDPLTNFPVSVADNAGKAAIRNIDDFMKQAPKRYIVSKVQFLPEWINENYQASDIKDESCAMIPE